MLNYQMVTVVSLESLNKQKGPTWIQHQSDIVWYQLRQQLCVSNWVASSSSSASSSNWGRSILVLCINIGGNLGPRTTKKKTNKHRVPAAVLCFFLGFGASYRKPRSSVKPQDMWQSHGWLHWSNGSSPWKAQWFSGSFPNWWDGQKSPVEHILDVNSDLILDLFRPLSL